MEDTIKEQEEKIKQLQTEMNKMMDSGTMASKQQ